MEGGDTTTTLTRFRWTIKNFSSLKDKEKHYSDVFIDSRGYKWQILMYPEGFYSDKHLSLFLHVADWPNLPAGWTRDAQYSLSVISQRNRKYNVTEEEKCQFNVNWKIHGFSRIMRLSVLHAPNKGFLFGDTLICEAEVAGGMTPKKVNVEIKNQETEIDPPTWLGGEVEGEPCLSPELRKLKNQFFNETPQNPHYSPLDKYSDTVRKGMMIGLDIAFVNLSTEIQKVDDPERFWSKLDGFTKQLRELEEMGYNVQKLRERLKDLKGIAECERAAKEAVEKFEIQVKEQEKKITEWKAEIDVQKRRSLDARKEFFASAAKRMRK